MSLKGKKQEDEGFINKYTDELEKIPLASFFHPSSTLFYPSFHPKVCSFDISQELNHQIVYFMVYKICYET